MTVTPSHSDLTQDILDTNEDTHCSDEPEDSLSPPADRRALQEALDSCNDFLELDGHAHARLDEYSYAAACLNFADQEKM